MIGYALTHDTYFEIKIANIVQVDPNVENSKKYSP